MNPQVSNAFVHVLQTHEGGAVCNDLADAMRACVQAVMETGKPASLTLAVKFLPTGKLGSALIVQPSVNQKLPPGDTSTSIWFADGDMNLTRHDPKQLEIPLRSVPAAAPAEPVKLDQAK